MSSWKKKTNFLETEEGVQFKEALHRMESDSSYDTESSYIANKATHPDNRIPFAEKHINYINAHQNIDAMQYLSNLRLRTRIR